MKTATRTITYTVYEMGDRVRPRQGLPPERSILPRQAFTVLKFLEPGSEQFARGDRGCVQLREAYDPQDWYECIDLEPA